VYLSTPLKEGYKHDDIFEFMPLSGDPTRKQIERIRAKHEMAEARKLQKEGEKLIKEYQKLGYL
jgi:hypothetical protein